MTNTPEGRDAVRQGAQPSRNGAHRDDKMLRYRPYPVDSLPEPLRGFVRGGAESIGCDPTYIALPLLAVCASAIGNTMRLRLKDGWDVPAILWVAIIGESDAPSGGEASDLLTQRPPSPSRPQPSGSTSVTLR